MTASPRCLSLSYPGLERSVSRKPICNASDRTVTEIPRPSELLRYDRPTAFQFWRSGETVTERTCIVCGVALPDSLRAHARFCSTKCRTRAHRSRSRAQNTDSAATDLPSERLLVDSGNGVEPVRAPESVSQATAVEPAKELHAPPVGAQVADEVMRGMVVPAVKCPRCAVTLLLSGVAPALMSADDALLAITKPPGTTGRRDKSPDPPAIDADNPDLSIAERSQHVPPGEAKAHPQSANAALLAGDGTNLIPHEQPATAAMEPLPAPAPLESPSISLAPAQGPLETSESGPERTTLLAQTPPHEPPMPAVDPRQTRRTALIARLDTLVGSWKAADKAPLLKLLYQECWLRDRCAGLVSRWRSESSYYRDAAKENEEFSLRDAAESMAAGLRDLHKTEQYQRRRPIPNKPGMSLSDSIEAALLRSTRVVIADLIEQVLDLPPSADELDAS